MATNKLVSKAAKLDFSKLPGVGAVAPGGSGPKTAPGALMAFANDARSGLLRENETLREQATQTQTLRNALDEARSELSKWEGAQPTRRLSTAHIVHSRFANRHAAGLSGPAFEQLKAEIAHAGGNVQPVKVRPVPGSAEPRYEVVFGHRRVQACRELELPVLAVVDALDDATLFIEMDRENRARKDLSAWEQGVMYQRALDEGLFSSNRKLAEAVGVDLGNLGRALALARLPSEVVAAFASPLDLQFRWAKALNDAATTDRDGLLARAQTLAQQKGTLSARAVFDRLVTPTPTPAAAPTPSVSGGGLYGTPPCAGGSAPRSMRGAVADGKRWRSSRGF